MKLKLIIASLFFQLLTSAQEFKKYPYWDYKLSVENRVDDLLKRLTIDDKIGLMMNKSIAIDRLGIPSYNWWNEALHGVARASTATVFPQAIAMAATFNPEEHFNTFSMISDEARAKYHEAQSKGNHEIYYGLTFWTPNINIFRDPRWGRGMETYGEDPFLTSCFGIAAVKGLQGNDTKYLKTQACAKHFAVHSGPEWNRHSFNVDVSPRDLWDTYLPAFEALVKKAKVEEVMCAYNRIDSMPCCGSNKLLVDILRNKWNYKGLIVSDCSGIDDFYKKGHHETHPTPEAASSAAVLTGTDIECGRVYESLNNAVKSGLITENQLNISVKRILKARFDLGMFDPDSVVSWTKIPYSVVDCQKHKVQALKVAQQSIVLLKNNNNLLPLSKKLRKIAVIGANAADSLMLWANYSGIPTKTTTILQGIQAKVPKTQLIYDQGSDLVENTVKVNLYNNLFFENRKGLWVDFFNNISMSGKPIYSAISTAVQYNNGGGTAFAPNVNLENFSARFKGEFIAPATKTTYFTIRGNDGYRLYIDGKIVAENWRVYRASSKTVTLEAVQGKHYQIMIEYFQSITEAELSLQIFHKSPLDFSKLKKKLKDVDAIIYVGGLSAMLEGEEMPVNYEGFRGGDREIIELPKIQRELLTQLHSLGKPTVFVLCTGSAIGLEDEDYKYDALLNAWYGGQAGGTAVADVIFGDYNPAGRLPVTFYKSTKQLPDFLDYNMDNRTYRYMHEKPMYPFGYGLSYTTFEYGSAIVSSDKITTNENVTVQFQVSNTGKLDGEEVVQLYVKRLNSIDSPIKSLKAVKRISIISSQSASVTFTLDNKSFQLYDGKTDSVKSISGDYQLLYGSSSDDKTLKSINLKVID